MRTIKQDELTSQIKLFFYNGVDLNRAFMNNVQVFQKYLVDVCFQLGKDASGTRYIFKEGQYGQVDKTMLVGSGIIIDEMSVSALGDWVIRFGSAGDEMIANAKFIKLVGDDAFVPPIFEWNPVDMGYSASDVDFAKFIIDDIDHPITPLVKLCININVLPEDILKYDFEIIKTGIRP